MTSRELLEQFYGSFQRHDHEGMTSCYADDVVFSDPAFGRLEGERAKAMWQMLIERGGSGLQIQYEILTADSDGGQVRWVADYTYGPKKRPVQNHVTAHITCKDGKIIEHHDHFDLWRWSRQALGLPGLLLGWSPFIKNKIQSTTHATLNKYLAG